MLWLMMLPFPVFSENAENAPSSTTDPGEIPALDHYYRWLKMGKSAIPELKEALHSADWRMRSHAALAMGQTGDASLTSLLMERLMSDPQQAVKNCAVVALGDLKATSAVPVLMNLLQGQAPSDFIPPLPRQRVVAQALGNIGDARALSPLFHLLLETPNEQLRIELAKALIRIQDPTISRWLQQPPANPERFPYVQAAQIVSELPVEGAEAFLLKLLKDRRLNVKNAAIIGLGKIRSQKSVPALLGLLKTGDARLLSNLTQSLTDINAASAVDPLCSLLDHPNADVAQAAASVLGGMTDTRIPQKVQDALTANHQANGPAAVVLGRKQWKNALPLLRERAKNEREPGQDQLCEALGWLEDRESIPLLMEVVGRESRRGSVSAIWALGHLKAKTAIPKLLAIIKLQDRTLTGPAVMALGEIGDPATVKPIINLFYESGFQYQLQIALALAQIGGPEAAEILKTNMESDEPKRWKMAGTMLMKSRDKSLIPYAVSLLRHPEPTVQRQALAALKNMTGLSYDAIEDWEAWAAKNSSLKLEKAKQ